LPRRDLPLEFVREVEMAAIASAWTLGQGGAPAINMAAKPGDTDLRALISMAPSTPLARSFAASVSLADMARL
jgi:hypothetical protein